MSLKEYEHFTENYSFRDLVLLLDQNEEEQRESTELIQLAVMYGQASANKGKLIPIFDKPKEVSALDEKQVEEIKSNKDFIQNTFSNTL